MEQLLCFMGKLNCRITTKNLIANEDIENFIRLIEVYRKCENEGDSENIRAFAEMIDAVILTVNMIKRKEK